MIFQSAKAHTLIAIILSCFIAIAFQVQGSLFATENYAGLRINMADLALPFAGVFILGSLLSGNSAWPAWQKPFGYGWPVLLTIILSAALLNGFRLHHDWSQWALVNKYTGWFVIMAYLALGGWLSSNLFTHIEKYFVRTLIFSFTAMATLLVALDVSGIYGQIAPGRILRGLMSNQNSFALLFMAVSIMVAIYGFKEKLFNPWFSRFFWFLFPVLVISITSRILWIAAIALILFLLFYNTRKFFLLVLPFLFLGICFTQVGYAEDQYSFHTRPFLSLINLYEVTSGKDYQSFPRIEHLTGDDVRVKILKASFELWQQHKILGAGLGSALLYQQEKFGEVFNLIDNTPFWILVEMGLLGFLGFAAAYVVMLVALGRKLKAQPEDSALILSTILFLLIFGLFSLVHEMLNTRFLWFMLGLSLAVPRTAQKA